MRRYGIRLSASHKRWFYAVAVLLFLSGALWILFGLLAEHDDARANLFRSIKSWSLKLHGAAAMVFLIALGILIPTHMKSAWQARRNRTNGAVIVAATATLVATGYGLYYFGDEQMRSAASWIHQIVGFASPALLALHIWRGRRGGSGMRPEGSVRP